MTDKAFTTCLWFDTEGEAAANYYTSIFKDSRLGRVGRYTEAGPGPAGAVMVVEFELNGQKFIALNGGPQFTFNEAISFHIPCADQDKANRATEAMLTMTKFDIAALEKAYAGA